MTARDPRVHNAPANGGQTKSPEAVIAADKTLAPECDAPDAPPGLTTRPGAAPYPVDGITYASHGYVGEAGDRGEADDGIY
jgi:hypothetical protein